MISVGEMGRVAYSVDGEIGGGLEDRLGPFGVFFEEDGSAGGVERGPHDGVVAEAEDEEVAGRDRAKDVEGETDLGE